MPELALEEAWNKFKFPKKPLHATTQPGLSKPLWRTMLMEHFPATQDTQDSVVCMTKC